MFANMSDGNAVATLTLARVPCAALLRITSCRASNVHALMQTATFHAWQVHE
eukprot:m.270192 g.270192  ORF g.270192 m.270192 type:complete len:52 (+) comp112524_c0_seq1:2-157(+)